MNKAGFEVAMFVGQDATVCYIRARCVSLCSFVVILLRLVEASAAELPEEALIRLLKHPRYEIDSIAALATELVLPPFPVGEVQDDLPAFISHLGRDHPLVRPLFPGTGVEIREWVRFFSGIAKSHGRQMKVGLDAENRNLLEFKSARGRIYGLRVHSGNVTFPLLSKRSKTLFLASGYAGYNPQQRKLKWLGPRTLYDLFILLHESGHRAVASKLTSTQRRNLIDFLVQNEFSAIWDLMELNAVNEHAAWQSGFAQVEHLRSKGVDPFPDVSKEDLMLIQSSHLRTYVDKRIWREKIARSMELMRKLFPP